MKKICFRLMAINEENAIKKSMEILRKFGIKVYDLKEVKCVDENGKELETMALICCVSYQSFYLEFKNRFKFEEIIHEGILTLH